MRTRLTRWNRILVVRGRIWGPSRSVGVVLVLDTGAAYTALRRPVLELASYEVNRAADRVPVTTASREESWPRISLARLAVLGDVREDIPVLSPEFTLAAGVDGLLGLDFFGERKLYLDLREGYLELT